MGVTSDRNDPGLKNVGPDGMQETYLVLSEEERAKGFVRPVRTAYVHLTCGAVTTMGLAIAESYSRDPGFYSGTYCAKCRAHFPVGVSGEFIWSVPREGTPIGSVDKVGT
jgi:hypothetical protein